MSDYMSSRERFWFDRIHRDLRVATPICIGGIVALVLLTSFTPMSPWVAAALWAAVVLWTVYATAVIVYALWWAYMAVVRGAMRRWSR